MKRIFAWLEAERAKLHGKSLRAKISYILMYYWVQIGLLVFVCAFGFYLHGRMSVQLYENHFAACFGNTFADLDADSPFGRGYAQYAGYDLSQKNLVLMDECWCNPGEASAFNNTYYNLLVTYLDSGTLDVLVMPKEDLCAVGQSGRLMDLRSPEVQDVFQKYAERLVYVMPNEMSDYSDEPVPVGIDLTGTALVGKGLPYEDDAVLGVNALAPHPDQAEVFLSYLFEEAAP